MNRKSSKEYLTIQITKIIPTINTEKKNLIIPIERIKYNSVEKK